MSKTLLFYDLETSGINPKESRIMQFACQRTDLTLNKIGEPQNILVKLSNDILPDPQAIFVTGITPQQSVADGITEAEFLKIFHNETALKDTIFVGFNSVRFDDEFIRYTNYRNFYDPYEWQWKDGRGKWDLLDVIRMTRALRPNGINWPVENGKPTNKLESMTRENNILHVGAHDALSDVLALVHLAKLIRDKQSKLFDYLLDLMSSKYNITKLVESNKPFVYTSGKYSSDYEKTTVVVKLVDHPKRQGALVFDLRFNPNDYINLSVEELVKAWRPKDKEAPELPIKSMQFNRCPAIAPLGVLDNESQKRISLPLTTIQANFNILQNIKTDFSIKVISALKILDADQDLKYSNNEKSVDAKLYDGFFVEGDKSQMHKIRLANPEDLNSSHVKFSDKRLMQLLPLYKARNYPNKLSSEELDEWESYRKDYLLSGDIDSRMQKFLNSIIELSKNDTLDSNKKYLLEELKLYAESIFPSSE